MRRLALLILVLLLAGFLGRPTVANALSDLVLTPVTAALACEAQASGAETLQPCPDKAPITVPLGKCNVGVLPCPAPQLTAEAGTAYVSPLPWQPAFRIYHSQFRPPRAA